MKKLTSNLAKIGLFLMIPIVGGPLDPVEAAEPDTQLLFHCLLDKSNSLDVYRVSGPAGETVNFELRNFLGSTETAMLMQNPRIVQYGNVLIALQDSGRSGYALLRFERGTKPAAEDAGDSTVLLDNNLFHFRENRIFTGGKLTLIRDCTAAPGWE